MVMSQEMRADILIVGGGVGGCAAAMAATSMGRSVVLTEPTDWLGGQLTSQAVPPDEHPWIEQFGCTALYRRYRELVRAYYREHYPLTAEAMSDRRLNPGRGHVSRLCHEPRVGVAVLEGMLAWARSRGLLRVLLEHEPASASVTGDRVEAVTLRDLRTNKLVTVRADYVLDATELGDLLPLAGVEYVSGAETRAETGELHAVADGDGRVAGPSNVQSLTWCMALGFDPRKDEEIGDEYLIGKPAQYERWRDTTPRLTPPWCGPLLGWDACMPWDLNRLRRYVLRPEELGPGQACLWLYRRILCADVLRDVGSQGKNFRGEVTIANWPQNDYWEGNIIDVPKAEAGRCLEEARQLSLSLLCWMQTEAPRPKGGYGYRGLHLRPDVAGTADGLAKAAYIRESRRIKALFTATEAHVGAEMRGGVVAPPQVKMPAGVGAESFFDSVGVGYYRIDLHPSTGGDNYIDISSLPYEIPLGALIPRRVENVLAACKNLGVTHISNGCYRLHPTEWNIGESAGHLAAWCLEKKIPPRAVRERAEELRAFQERLTWRGVELRWPGVGPV
ncbi:MAG: FAD-dependent oxidoreductase [Phycisphaeraceae bacterium]|nr:FAD-dependent oxidoreductase [Phycisphaeraceae bacterium]